LVTFAISLYLLLKLSSLLDFTVMILLILAYLIMNIVVGLLILLGFILLVDFLVSTCVIYATLCKIIYYVFLLFPLLLFT